MLGLLFLLTAAFRGTASVPFRSIKSGIKSIEVFAVQIILCDAEGFTETLEVYDFALAQEFDRLTDIRLFNQAKDVVIGRSGLLFCYTFISTK